MCEVDPVIISAKITQQKRNGKVVFKHISVFQSSALHKRTLLYQLTNWDFGAKTSKQLQLCETALSEKHNTLMQQFSPLMKGISAVPGAALHHML